LPPWSWQIAAGDQTATIDAGQDLAPRRHLASELPIDPAPAPAHDAEDLPLDDGVVGLSSSILDRIWLDLGRVGHLPNDLQTLAGHGSLKRILE